MEIKNENYNKDDLSSQLNFPSSLNNNENKFLYENLQKYEEEKNEARLSFSFKDNLEKKDKIIIKINNSTNESKNENKLIKENQYSIPKNSSSLNNNDKIENIHINKIINEKEEMIQNDLILDEIKLKVDYDKIESELNRLRNNSNGQNKMKESIIKKDDNTNINDLSNKDNQTIQRVSLYSSSQIEGDLFYYSEEDDDKFKQIKSNNEKIKIIQNNLNKLEEENKDNFKEKNNISSNEEINNNIEINKLANKNKNENEVNNFYINNHFINERILEKVEFGIDETGNPLNLKEYKDEISKNSNCKKLIAYIIQSEEEGKNYLIDLKGEIIPKMEDGDFNYKKDNMRIIIKNFDVQNPKLRVFGARKRYSSIMFEEENISQNLTQEKNEYFENQTKEIKNNNIEEEFINKKCSPLENLYYYGQKFNENIKNNIYFKNWINNYSPTEENKRIFHYKNDQNEILYEKIPLKRINDENIINNSYNNERNCFLEKTNKILNTNRNILLNNQKLIERLKYNNNIKNIFFDKKQIVNNKWRNNRTPSPIIREMVNEGKNINNVTSRVNLYKIKRLKKGGSSSCNNYNMIFKLKLDNNCPISSNSESQIIKSTSSSFNNFIKNNHSLFKKMDQVKKDSNSLYLNNNYFNKNNISKPILKKSLSSNNYQLATTLNSIANNIKKIEYNIKNTLQKLFNKNRVLNKSNEPIKTDISISEYNSKQNNSPYYLTNNLNNKSIIFKNKSNNNLVNGRNINLRKISLNKKFKISTSPKKEFQCSVLSSEANKMIKDYTNKSLTQRNINKNPINKINIQNFMKNVDKNKIKNILNKSKKKINNNSNNSSKKILNKNKNNESKSQKNNLLKIKFNKDIKSAKRKTSHNKSFNNKKHFEKAIPLQNNLNINFYSRQNKTKTKNSALKIITNAIRRKTSKDSNKFRFSSQSTSINSLKEIPLNGKY